MYRSTAILTVSQAVTQAVYKVTANKHYIPEIKRIAQILYTYTMKTFMYACDGNLNLN